jgi:hypothetical protein
METSNKGCKLTRYLTTLLAAIAILNFNQEATMDTKENTTDDHSQSPGSYVCIAYHSCVLLFAKSCLKCLAVNWQVTTKKCELRARN